MNIKDFLTLQPQHIEELRDFYSGFKFDDVEIVAHEVATTEQQTPWSFGFNHMMSKLTFDTVFFGKNHMHAIFYSCDDDDDTFFC